jgi:hypothetical protein
MRDTGSETTIGLAKAADLVLSAEAQLAGRSFGR